MIAGDCIQSIRTSLDHLVWNLAGCPDPTTARTNFPILQPPFIAKQTEQYLASALAGIPDEARALIESLQPDRGQEFWPRYNPLLLLAQLSNTDKHRSLVLTAASIEGATWNWFTDAEPALGPVDDGDVLIRVPTGQPLHYRAKFGLAFASDGPMKGMGVINGTEMLIRAVEYEIFPRFEKFF